MIHASHQAAMRKAAVWLTPFKIGAEYGLVALNLGAALALWRRMRMRTPQPFDAPALFLAVCTRALSELRLVFETIPDLLFMKAADGTCLDCNPAFERLYGSSRANIVGKTPEDFVSPKEAAAFRATSRRRMRPSRRCA